MTAAVWLLSSVLIPASTWAQSQAPSPTQTQPAPPPIPPGPLTLDQVLSLAEPRSEAVSIAVAGVRRAEGDQVRAQSGLRPQLSAAASYDRALASEFDGVFDTTDTGPVCPPFALNPTAGIDARVAEIERAIDCGAVGGGGGFFGSTGDLSDLPFGRKNTWRASLSFSQNLWSGGRNGAQIALASAGHETAQLGVTTTRAQLLFEVAQAYYDAVLSEQLVNIAAATLEQAGATLRQVEAGLSAGTQPEFEVLRARVTRDQQQPVLIRQRVNRALAYLRLKRLLDLPPEADLQLANSLEDENLPPAPTFVERVSSVENALRSNEAADLSITSGLSMPARTAIDQARATVRTREASLQLTAAQKMPSVSLNSTYARIAYPENLAPTFDRANWSVGISMSVPLLTGGRQRGDEAVAKAELEQSLLQQRQMEELAALDTRSAWAELLASRVAWESTAGTVQQANRAYEIADVRYGAGVSTQLELSDARVQRQQAEANRAVAARDLQVARARVALLPELPVGNAIPGAAPIIQQQTAPGAVPGQQAPQNNGQLRNASAQFTQPQAGTR
ncbi:MAG TPA: TolC family protein [Vicinamibacterales bacterium]|nr:TolC family protein [Vicinamibacterales bacterium]